MKNALKRRILEGIFKFIGGLSRANRVRLGAVLYKVGALFLKKRTHIVRTNLKLCFPDISEHQREIWLQQHLRALAQSVVDRGLIWYGSKAQICEDIELKHFDRLQAIAAKKQPFLVLGPHFIGLDIAASRLTMLVDEAATIYTPQSDPVFDDIIRRGRARFNTVHLISRKDGVRGMLKYLRQGLPVYYLPDMDFGRQGSIFVPFFGVPAATLPTTAVLADKFKATVLPVLTHWDPKTGKYTVDIQEPLENFPGDDSTEAATARLNRILEEWIKRDPSQYYWVHRRFKTRPNREDPKFY
ncbi:lysophospholipid acyltransferase family protein [Brackiella oedipodis]|uniref:lysophospholipid acyltransferase family protein n=1 Tax=Brackiella oedipodis TaxID=124225 RepID=UPI000491E9A7|nr:lysophospholipid acyltransferase family protein [Brackiella oedipodis]